MDILNYFELAGFNKEDSEKIIKICNECGVDYERALGSLQSYKSLQEIEYTIRKTNSKGY